MRNMQIVPPARGAALVTVFEPRQSPEQQEVIIDQFEMVAGEEPLDYSLPSATAAYRFEDIAESRAERVARTKELREKKGVILNRAVAPPQPPGPSGIPADTHSETEMGSQRVQEYKQREKSGKPAPRVATGSNNPEKQVNAEDELAPHVRNMTSEEEAQDTKTQELKVQETKTKEEKSSSRPPPPKRTKS